MPAKQKDNYVICQQPPATLTEKARKQLDNAKPSIKMALLAKDVAKLISTSGNGEKTIVIPANSLRPGDVSNAMTAKEAAASVRTASDSTRSGKQMAKAA